MFDGVSFTDHDTALRAVSRTKPVEKVVDPNDEIAQSEILSQEQSNSADLLGYYFRQNPDTTHMADAVSAEARKVFAVINLSNRIRIDFPGPPQEQSLYGKYSKLTQHVEQIKSSLQYRQWLISAARDQLEKGNREHFGRLEQISELAQDNAKNPALLKKIQESEDLLKERHSKNSAPHGALIKFLDSP